MYVGRLENYMNSEILNILKRETQQRIWFISDLQQSIPDNARYCMEAAVKDFHELGRDCDKIIYLGDAVEGYRLGFLEEMLKMQVDQLGRLDTPIRYVIGNHAFDYYYHNQKELDRVVLPFYERVKELDNWTTSKNLKEFYSIEDFGDYAIVYFDDHAALDGSWFTRGGRIHGDEDIYPYDKKTYELIREEIASLKKPVFTASHYAFPGGNRESGILEKVMPLPDNVKIHFYGHAHIGDRKWAGKDCFRKISWVDDHDIQQINVASLENMRGSAIRSVFFETYEDGRYGILFRNHTLRRWDEIYLI